MDKLHVILIIVATVGPVLSAIAVAWLKQHGHDKAAAILQDTLRAVIRGVEEAGDPATKDAIQGQAVLANVEHVLNPLVKDETAPSKT